MECRFVQQNGDEKALEERFLMHSQIKRHTLPTCHQLKTIVKGNKILEVLHQPTMYTTFQTVQAKQK